MKAFSFYDTVGVIAPGTVLIAGGLILFFPKYSNDLLKLANLSLGSLGIGLILAYVAGEILQAVGDAVEMAWWWLWGGMPTDWLRSGKRDLMAPVQRDLVQSRVRGMICDASFVFSDVTSSHWYAITRQIYAATFAVERSTRIDIFNGIYGLCRGIAAAFLLLLGVSVIVQWQAWRIEIILAMLTVLTLYRMHCFGVHYGRELFIQYLQLPIIPSTGGQL